MEEYSVKSRLGIRSLAFCMQMMYADILQFAVFSSLAESFYKYSRSTCDTAQVDMVTGDIWENGGYMGRAW